MGEKIARITKDKELMLKGEIVEYPSELEGGRNLVLNSGLKNNKEYWIDTFQGGLNAWKISTEEKWNGLNVLELAGMGGAHGWRGIGQMFEVAEGETYTFSVYAKCDPDITHSTIIRLEVSEDGKTWTRPLLSSTRATEWERIVNTYTIAEDIKYLQFSIINSPGNDIGKNAYVAGAKLEKGTIATDWSPALEDLWPDYPNVKTKFLSDGTMLVPELIENDDGTFSFSDTDVQVAKLIEDVSFGGDV